MVTCPLKEGLVAFARAVSISGAIRVESVLVRSLCVGVLLLLSTDTEAFESQARGLVDRWQIKFGARCCLRQSIVDVGLGTPSPGRRLALADVVLGFLLGTRRVARLDFALNDMVASSLISSLSHQGDFWRILSF